MMRSLLRTSRRALRAPRVTPRPPFWCGRSSFIAKRGPGSSLRVAGPFSRYSHVGLSRVEMPLEVSDMGHNFLGLVDFDGRRGSQNRDPSSPAPVAEWACARRRPNASDGGFRLSLTVVGMCRYAPPRTFSTCKAVTLWDARDGALSGPKKILMKSHVNWGTRVSSADITRIG